MSVIRKETPHCGWQQMAATLMWCSCLCRQELMWMLQIIGKSPPLCLHFVRYVHNIFSQNVSEQKGSAAFSLAANSSTGTLLCCLLSLVCLEARC